MSEPSDGDQDYEMSDDSSDVKSDTMSVDSDRSFFKFEREKAMKELCLKAKSKANFEVITQRPASKFFNWKFEQNWEKI